MTDTYAAGDRVRVRHRADLVVEGTVWSGGPDYQTYWVIPDQPQPDMIQGCIKASLSQMEETTDDTVEQHDAGWTAHTPRRMYVGSTQTSRPRLRHS